MGDNSGSRASTEPVPVSALSGFDPGRIIEWADKRYAELRAERQEALAEEDRESAALAVGGMLAMLEIKSQLAKEATQ